MGATASAFHVVHEQRYGHRLDAAVELVNLRCRLQSSPPSMQLPVVANRAIAATELCFGLYAVCRAETLTGADYYIRPDPNSVEDLESIVPDVPFPCALKPRFSHEYRGRNILKKLFVVNNKEELFAEFKGMHELGQKYKSRSDLIVTDIIPGFKKNATIK